MVDMGSRKVIARNPAPQIGELMNRETILKILKEEVLFVDNAADRIIAAMPEPLAVLADRKGLFIHRIGYCEYPVGWLFHFKQKEYGTYDWGGVKEIPDENTDNIYEYPAAESAARAYLNGLDDVKGEKK